MPLGLLHQQEWARDLATLGQRHQRRQRATAEKESQRWLDTLAVTGAAVPPATQALTVADREADISELFAAARPPGRDLLIRATHNRRVTHQTRYLWDALAATPGADVVPLAVGRGTDRPPREARLTVRSVALALCPPRHHRQRTQLAPIPVVAILAEEPSPPPDQAPVRWLLLTTRPVTTTAQAVQCLRWYAMRWLIERYHSVLKSGCRLEQVQVRTVERLSNVLATFRVAWRRLWLSSLARADPGQSCTLALAGHEWQALAATHHQTAIPPPTPPPLAAAVRWIAQLGGFPGRAGDGEPGVATLWPGLRRLDDIAATWLLIHGPPSSHPDMGKA